MNTRRMTRVLLATAVTAAWPSAAAPVLGRQLPTPGAEAEARARQAIDRLWSPYCPGLMLEVCTSTQGEALRDSIHDQAEAGLSADSIVEFWVARHGEEYRALPRFGGVGRAAWLMPPLAIGAGLCAFLLFTDSRRRRRSEASPPFEPTSDQEADLAQALAELDEAEAPDY